MLFRFICLHQKQTDEKARLGEAVDALLQPVRLGIAGVQPKGEDGHQYHPQHPQQEKDAGGEVREPSQNPRAAEVPPIHNQRRQQHQEACGHQDPLKPRLAACLETKQAAYERYTQRGV